MRKKIIVYFAVAVALTVGTFFVLFIIALREGPSIDTLTNRISESLVVSPLKLSYLGGYKWRDPSVFFMLSGEIPERADLRVLKGWAREDGGGSFNRLATRYEIPCVVNEHDELLYYKGDVFDLFITKTPQGYCILYMGF